MQVLLDSLRGALGFALLVAAFGLIFYFVMIIDTPPREQIEAYFAARNRQVTVVFGGLLMFVTIFGIGVFGFSIFRS